MLIYKILVELFDQCCFTHFAYFYYTIRYDTIQ